MIGWIDYQPIIARYDTVWFRVARNRLPPRMVCEMPRYVRTGHVSSIDRPANAMLLPPFPKLQERAPAPSEQACTADTGDANRIGRGPQAIRPMVAFERRPIR